MHKSSNIIRHATEIRNSNKNYSSKNIRMPNEKTQTASKTPEPKGFKLLQTNA